MMSFQGAGAAERVLSDSTVSRAQEMLRMAQFADCDGEFGPWALSCRHGRFGFTLMFEQLFLSILPSVIFLTASLVQIGLLLGRKPKIATTVVHYSKLVACSVLIALELATLWQWTRISDELPSATILAAASLAVADALILALLSNLEHTRSTKPSSIIAVYLVFSILFDVVRCRTLLLLRNLAPLTATFAAGVAAKVIILYLESRNKRSILIGDWKALGHEATSSILNTAFLWWVNPILWRGHTSFLKLSELPALEPQFRSQNLLPKMLQNWEKYKSSSKYALLWTLMSTTKPAIIGGAIPRLVLAVSKMIVPFFVAEVISYVSNYDENGNDENRQQVGYALIAGTALLFLSRAVIQLAYEQAKNRTRVQMQSALIATILHKAAQMEPEEKKGAASLTLITADTSRVVTAFETIHELWVTPLEILLATWLLARQVGFGSIGPVTTAVLGLFLSGILAKYIGAAQKGWIEAKQQRISNTTTILGSMKEIKMLGLAEPCKQAIQSLLDSEMVKSIAFRKVLSLLNAAGRMPDTFAPAITFGVAILFSHGTRLSISEAFTSISIMSLIIGPLTNLAQSFPFTIASLPCFERIQDFIELCSAYEARIALLGASAEVAVTVPLLPGFDEPLFATRNANITVKSRAEPLITDASLTILPGTFNVVAGKVASGKSLLLRALMGQLPLSGDVSVRTSNIAYCAQTPWIITGTAKENIMGKSPRDEAWYRTVVTACALDRDFAEFPQGDSVPIGSKGISLSGGQKQRLSLARALFSRKPVVFIDDVLSGLDWTTQRFVWKEVFGPSGLLRKNGITTVLATHALHLVDNPDSIILLGDSGPGSVIQGTMEQLKTETKLGDLISTSNGSHESAETSRVSADGSQKGDASTNTAVPGVDDAEADLLRKTGDSSLYLYYLKAVDWASLVGFVTTGALCALWPVLPQVWLMWWTEANESADQVNTALYFWTFAVLETGKVLTLLLAVWYGLVIFAPKAVRVLHSRLLQTTMSAPLSFFVATPQGDLVNRFSKDIGQVDLMLPMSMFTLLINGLALVRAFGLVMLGSLYLGFVAIPMLGFVYVLQKFYLRTSRQLRYLDLQSLAPLNTHLIETIDGVATIQAFGWQDALQAEGAARLDEAMKPDYLLSVIQNWLNLVLGLFVSVVSVLLIGACVALPQSTSTGGIALSLTNLLALSGSLSILITSWTSLETSLGASERLRTFETKTPQEMPPAHPASLPPAWPSGGNVQLQSITASYEVKGETAPLRALNNVDVQIFPGQKVAVCGRTGSGKSSLLLSLFRMLDLDSGSIVLDGVDIASVTQNLLRTRLISVPQEPMLLPGTLRFNLSPWKDEAEGGLSAADDAVVIDCLKAVELWDTLEEKGGLDAQVSDLQLSHGQKQLVCLARALARKDSSSIVILDEAMSAVDKQNEELMVKVLEEHFSKHTIISVVHRLNTIEKFDLVLLLDSGIVVESGSPESLLAKEDGHFRALWEGRGK